MKQVEALGILESGQNVLLTGAAGTGKTYLLNRFISRARAGGKSVAVTASTGIAATHLGGSTIHAWAGIGIHDTMSARDISKINPKKISGMQEADILIIDEVSMLHGHRLDLIERITSHFRKDTNPEGKAFGGLQVVLCGDFFQLPPVERSSEQGYDFEQDLLSPDTEARKENLAVDGASWAKGDFKICYLTEAKRQAEDTAFNNILDNLRNGKLTAGQYRALIASKDNPLLNATKLHTTNINVDRVNGAELDKIEQDSIIFDAITRGPAWAVENLQKNCLAPGELELKVGALVMCVKNDPAKKFVNGSIGRVQGFAESGYPNIKLNNGLLLEIPPASWELKEGDRVLASLMQVPLRLAWAITVHKSQGLTLDAAEVDLSKAFEPGMGYVALSRVRNLASLRLLGINRTGLTTSDRAKLLDIDFRARSNQHRQEFGHLADKIDSNWDTTPENSKTEGRVRVKKTGLVAEARKIHPKAYTPWDAASNNQLADLFAKKLSLDELVKLTGRSPGSIVGRLLSTNTLDAVREILPEGYQLPERYLRAEK